MRHFRAIKLTTIATLSAFVLATPSNSFSIELEFADGKVTGRLDTTLSVGVSARTSDRDQSIIGVQNGGTANSVNGDNGNLNYDRWDLTSASAKATHELDLGYKNFGLFVRGFYWYDTVIMDEDTDRTPLTKSAERYVGSDARLMDAFVTADIEAGDTNITIKGGNQVINWGESTFIQNGLNTINPFDVSKLRVAGAELRDALRPIPAIDINVGLNENLSFEGFYLLDWDHTEIEPEGTFFSTNDFAGPGGNQVFLGFGQPPIPDNFPLPPGINAPVGVVIPRGNDRDADDWGQFGLAIRYFAPELNDTEFGVYWTRLHSRLPFLSATTGTLAGIGMGNYAASANYFREFPEDIDKLGVSFNTEIGDSGVALQGEFSYTIDQPLQVDDVELLYAGLSPLDAAVFGMSQLGAFGLGTEITGYREKDVMQFQTTATKLLGPNLGADQVVLLGEVGFTYVDDLEDKSTLRYEGPGTYTSANPFFTLAGLQPATETDGFADDFSWGYRLVARADYNNAVGAVNLQPTIAFAHDRGTTPTPLSNFVNDRKTVTLSLGATYLEKYAAKLSYTNSFGGDRWNLSNDRDFLSLVASYSF